MYADNQEFFVVRENDGSSTLSWFSRYSMENFSLPLPYFQNPALACEPILSDNIVVSQYICRFILLAGIATNNQLFIIGYL
jgi:hypothetical protein